MSAERLLFLAAAAEARQTHPIARAIVRRAAEHGIAPSAEGFEARYQVGAGIEAILEGQRVVVGSARLMESCGQILPDSLTAPLHAAHAKGNTLIYVAISGQTQGAIELCPTVRVEVLEVIAALKERGLALHILSGDHQAPTQWLAEKLQIPSFFAGVLPEGKATIITQLQAAGHRVCYVGDGLNDAIALKTADASISLQGAATAATDSAQVIMMDGSLRQLPGLLTLVQDFAGSQRNSLRINLWFGAITVGGIFLASFGIFSAIGLYVASLVVTVAHAMKPMVRYREREPVPGSADEPRNA